MKKLKWFDEHFEESFLVLFLALICIVELVQVIVRKIPFIPALTWAEEFCRFLWIWSVFLSVPYTIKKGTMLAVSLLPDLLPGTAKKLLKLFVDAVVLIAMTFCAYHSVAVVRGIAESGETSPAMLWPMWFVYSFMLFGFVLAVLRTLQRLIRHIKTFPADTEAEGGGE